VQRLSARAGWLALLVAGVLFAYGVLADALQPVLAQTLLTFVGISVGFGLLGLYLRPPPPRRALGPVGLAFIGLSQVAFLLLVWTDWKQEALLWRFWWATAVPSLTAAHLRLMRVLGVEWGRRLGRVAAGSICAHGLSWVLLVCRKDLLADPPGWYVAIMALCGGVAVLSTLIVYGRYRKAHAGEPSPYPMWVRWTAIGAGAVLLFLSGLYVGRITASEEAIFEAFPSALAGMPPEEIDAGVRADAARLEAVAAGMTDLSNRFPGMRLKFQGAMKAEGREYLKAPEDDDLRGTYMSFLSMRSALLRLVAVYAGFESVRDPALRARCFLVAYAAATALMSSESRLVTTFQDWDVARRKLNEPDPRWGIAAGMFDRIAAGIASDRNVERFEEMAAYFEERAPLWREEEVWPPDRMAWFEANIRHGIEAARSADVHKHRNWLRRVVSKVKSDAYSPVYAVQSQLSVWIGDTRVVTRAPLIDFGKIEELKGRLRAGDIILERRNFFLSNAFLPGFWPHAALYVGGEEGLAELGIRDHPDVKAKLERFLRPAHDGHRNAIIEAVSEGVVFNSLEHSIHADFVAVLRPRASREKKGEAVARAFANEGKPYDFEFDFFTTDRLVCTEVVYRSYEGIVHFDLQRVMGRDTLPAIEIVRKFARERGKPDAELEFVAFLDGKPEEGRAEFCGEEDFCKSADRPREFHE
jgi:hypothetical protein